MTKVTIDRTFFPECVKAIEVLKRREPISGFRIGDNFISRTDEFVVSFRKEDIIGSIRLRNSENYAGYDGITVFIGVWFENSLFTYLFKAQMSEFPEEISSVTIPEDSTGKFTAMQAAGIREIFIQNQENLNVAYLAVVQAIQKGLTAQSKEDFYDDASDYQDDEPTDFGDASNYDENLVQRIKRAIGS